MGVEERNEYNDLDLALESLSHRIWYITDYERLSPQIKNDKNSIMKLLASGVSLHVVSEELKNDKDVVLAAMAIDCKAFRFAGRKLMTPERKVLIVDVTGATSITEYNSNDKFIHKVYHAHDKINVIKVNFDKNTMNRLIDVVCGGEQEFLDDKQNVDFFANVIRNSAKRYVEANVDIAGFEQVEQYAMECLGANFKALEGSIEARKQQVAIKETGSKTEVNQTQKDVTGNDAKAKRALLIEKINSYGKRKDKDISKTTEQADVPKR